MKKILTMLVLVLALAISGAQTAEAKTPRKGSKSTRTTATVAKTYTPGGYLEVGGHTFASPKKYRKTNGNLKFYTDGTASIVGCPREAIHWEQDENEVVIYDTYTGDTVFVGYIQDDNKRFIIPVPDDSGVFTLIK